MSQVDELAQEIRNLPRGARAPAVAGLAELVRDEATRPDAIMAFLNLSDKHILVPDELEPHLQIFLGAWKEALSQVKPKQQAPEKLEWQMDEDYSGLRQCAEILLDLFGHLPMSEAGGYLREALSLTDPRLQLFAALSLLRNLEPVSSSDLEKIAASHQTRIFLWEQLNELGMESLMPMPWAESDKLAASELSRWVSSPMELGAPPEEIELMRAFSVAVDSWKGDVYLFRFREFPKPWEAGEGWMAGIAGPIRDGQTVGSCWSSFEPWDSMTPEEHFAKLRSVTGY